MADGVWELLGLLVLAGGAWFWLDGLKARERGVAAARAACDSEGLQLLDDTVSLASLRLARDEDGRLVPKREYEFEYSDTGDNRRRGRVLLLGHRAILIDIGLRRAAGQQTLH